MQRFVILLLIVFAVQGVQAQEVTPEAEARGQILIEGRNADGRGDVLLIDVSSGETINLTDTADETERAPRWIDADTILYSLDEESSLFTADLTPEQTLTNVQSLPGDSAGIITGTLTVSPDGRQAAYLVIDSAEPLPATVYTIALDGQSDPDPLVQSSSLWINGWSLDGEALWVTASVITDRGSWDTLYRVTLEDGTAEPLGEERLTLEATLQLRESSTGAVVILHDRGLYDAEDQRLMDAVAAAWSPDGSTLAVVNDGGLWLLTPPDADAPTRSAPPTLLLEQKIVSGPAWSPDGRAVVVLLDAPEADSVLAVIDVETGALLLALTLPLPEWAQPAWRP